MKNNIKIIKAACLSFFCLLLSGAFWYFLNNLFLWRQGSIITDLISVSISFSLFFIFSMIYLLLVDNRKIIIISSFFITFSLLVFFLRRDGMWVEIYSIIGYTISALILFTAYNLTNKNIQHDRKNSIVFHAGKSILKAGPMLLVVFAVLFSVIFYFNSPLINDEEEIEVKESIVERLARPFGNIINNYIPIYYPDMSVDEFIVLSSMIGFPFAKGEEELIPPVNMEKPPERIANYLRSKGIYDLENLNLMEHLKGDEEFRVLFLEELKELTDQTNPYLMYKYRDNLSQNWGIELNGSDKMVTVYTRLLNSKINQIPPLLRNLLLISPSLLLFSVLEISFLILNFIYSFLCWIILIIFYKSRFYHYRKVKVEKEEIEL